jgi:hypothetical protein
MPPTRHIRTTAMIIQHLANLPSSCPIDSSSLESCISALKSSISALESSAETLAVKSGFWETFSWLCAIAVGIGIAGEIVVIVSEHREDFDDWRRCIIRPSDRPPLWRFRFDIAATLLVLAGVFGEAGATGEVASINSRLRSKASELRAKNDLLLAVITEEAGDAKVSADGAAIAAASAKASAGDAKMIADNAFGQSKAASVVATGAQGKAEKVAVTADTLNRELAISESKRAELERSLAPRLIPLRRWPDGVTNIDDLKPHPAGTEVVLEYIQDAEAGRAAANIRFLLEAAGWTIASALPIHHDTADGITISAYLRPEGANDNDPAERAAEWSSIVARNTLRTFFADNDWRPHFGYAWRGEIKRGSVRITVGFKPSPYFSDPSGREKAMLETLKSNKPKRNPAEASSTILSLEPPVIIPQPDK